MTLMNAWQLTSDPVVLRRMGKTIEEASELCEVLSVMTALPSDSCVALLGARAADEIADVLAQCRVTITALALDKADINRTIDEDLARPQVGPTPPALLSGAVARLSMVCSRIIIQGIDEIDPGSKLPNRERLANAVAQVMYECRRVIQHYRLNEAKIAQRIAIKVQQMHEWEALYHAPTEAGREAATA